MNNCGRKAKIYRNKRKDTQKRVFRKLAINFSLLCREEEP